MRGSDRLKSMGELTDELVRVHSEGLRLRANDPADSIILRDLRMLNLPNLSSQENLRILESMLTPPLGANQMREQDRRGIPLELIVRVRATLAGVFSGPATLKVQTEGQKPFVEVLPVAHVDQLTMNGGQPFMPHKGACQRLLKSLLRVIRSRTGDSPGLTWTCSGANAEGESRIFTGFLALSPELTESLGLAPGALIYSWGAPEDPTHFRASTMFRIPFDVTEFAGVNFRDSMYRI